MIVIAANGETPEGEALETLKSAERVIACDGAYARLKSLGIEPDFVVGDCDSISDEDRRALGSKLVRVDEQETNDLEKAFRFAIEMAGMLPRQFGRDASTMRPGSAESGRAVGASLPDARTPCAIISHPQIVIVGVGGGREDHLIGNVFRLLDFAERVPDVAMLTNAGRFDVVKGERTFGCVPGQAVSVFAPVPGTRVESEGLKWPLGGVDLSRLWSGTLNRTTARGFNIRSTAPVLVYRCGRDASTMRPGSAGSGRAVGASLPSVQAESIGRDASTMRPGSAESGRAVGASLPSASTSET